MKKWILALVLLLMTTWAILSNTVFNEAKKEEQVVDPNVKLGANVGEAAINFKLQTLTGDEIRLTDYRGKKVMINVWATWCPPCRAEMPEMQRFYEDIKAQGVEVFAVNATSSEKNPNDVQAFIKENNYTFPVLLDEMGNVSADYKIVSIPTSFFIDTKGIIRARHTGPMTYEDMKRYVEKLN